MNEISTYNYDDCQKLVHLLLKNNYVCMVSVEDSREDGTCLYVIDYLWTPTEANRNYVKFMSIDEYEDELDKLAEEIKNESI
ncbi:MAG: hypothetical protein KBT03_02835 [Bacteroidales bacterium]|nr:hypothetical protein [Candidatus Scybalousia scybalohippi]